MASSNQADKQLERIEAALSQAREIVRFHLGRCNTDIHVAGGSYDSSSASSLKACMQQKFHLIRWQLAANKLERRAEKLRALSAAKLPKGKQAEKITEKKDLWNAEVVSSHIVEENAPPQPTPPPVGKSSPSEMLDRIYGDSEL